MKANRLRREMPDSSFSWSHKGVAQRALKQARYEQI
jgi:hypothetical protein